MNTVFAPTRRSRSALLSSAMLVVAAATIPAHAAAAELDQDSSQPAAGPSAAAPEESNVALGDVVVTARRVEEYVQRVPVTVVAISSKQLERADVVDINSLQKVVPGYQGGARYVGNTLAGSTYRVRGLPGIATFYPTLPRYVYLSARHTF